jgi:hypothetical protein
LNGRSSNVKIISEIESNYITLYFLLQEGLVF